MSIESLQRDAQSIVDHAARVNRDLTPGEERRVDQLLGQIRDEEGKAMERELAGHGPAAGGGILQPHAWSQAVQDHVTRTGRGDLKELIPGGMEVPMFLPEIPRLGEPPTDFLGLLGVRPLTGETNAFSYLAETVRDMNAAPVASGEVKPTSQFTLELKEGRAEVIAHLSEPIDRFLLSDFRNLDMFLRDEMVAGISQALQEQVLYGDGTSPQLAGLVPQIGTAVSGADVIVLIRQAMATLESQGIAATAVVMNTMDAAAVDLLQDQIGRYYGAGPFGGGPNTLWGLPRLSTPALHEGEAVVGDFGSVLLFTKDTVNLMWSDATGENWQRNLVTFRCEGRFGLGVIRPFAFRLLDASQIGPASPEPEGQTAPATGGPGAQQSAPVRASRSPRQAPAPSA